MTKTLTISDNTIDELIKDVLIQDWRSLGNMITELEALTNPKDYELADLTDNRRYYDALTVTIGFYIEAGTYQTLLKSVSR